MPVCVYCNTNRKHIYSQYNGKPCLRLRGNLELRDIFNELLSAFRDNIKCAEMINGASGKYLCRTYIERTVL